MNFEMPRIQLEIGLEFVCINFAECIILSKGSCEPIPDP